MCGLAGWIAPARRAAPEDGLLAMLQALAHRHGADETLFAYAGGGASQVMLGAAHCDTASGVAIAVDGTPANLAELRARLGRQGIDLARAAAAEVLARAYLHWDRDFVKQMRGAFAVALWDPRKERLLLARDRLGEKPLFFAARDGGLWFASETGALLAAPGARAVVDPQAWRECVARGYVRAPRTLLAGVRSVAPGGVLLWQFGRLHESRYWMPPDRQPVAPATRTVADTAEALVERLDEATRLAPDAGILLSGGIDSAALVAVAARAGGEVRTWSLGFEGDRRSELPAAAAVAKQFGTRHTEIVVKPAELVPALESLVARRGAPLARPSELAVYRLAGEAGKVEKRVLTGDGCDEVLGGYRRHAAERLHPGFCESRLARRQRVASLLCASIPEESSDETTAEKSTFEADASASALRRALYADQTESLPGEILDRNDRAGVAAGVALAHPFLDHRLVELVSSLPDTERVRGLATKVCLRRAAERLFQSRLALRKAGFRMPIRDWLRHDLRDMLLDHLAGAASRTRGYYDTRLLDRLIAEHLEGKANHQFPLWTLLNLEIWHRRHRPA